MSNPPASQTARRGILFPSRSKQDHDRGGEGKDDRRERTEREALAREEGDRGGDEDRPAGDERVLERGVEFLKPDQKQQVPAPVEQSRKHDRNQEQKEQAG